MRLQNIFQRSVVQIHAPTPKRVGITSGKVTDLKNLGQQPDRNVGLMSSITREPITSESRAANLQKTQTVQDVLTSHTKEGRPLTPTSLNNKPTHTQLLS